MEFGEKLFKLRKEKGFSQETLAEKMNTTRQAISKWENGQGYPETEKLILLGSIFEVSIDYLLKDSENPDEITNEGYYVSREKAESWISHEKHSTGYIAGGIASFICAAIPFALFDEKSPFALLGGIIFVIIGISLILITSFTDRDFEYKPLKQNKLIFDRNYLSELTLRYQNVKKKYIFMVILFPTSTLFGGAICQVAYEYYHISMKTLTLIFVPILALGLYMFIYAIASMDAYELLVYNDEYIHKLSTRFMNMIRNGIYKKTNKGVIK